MVVAGIVMVDVVSNGQEGESQRWTVWISLVKDKRMRCYLQTHMLKIRDPSESLLTLNLETL